MGERRPGDTWQDCIYCKSTGKVSVKRQKTGKVEQVNCKHCNGKGGWWVPFGGGLLILLLMYLFFTASSCTKEPISMWEDTIMSDNTYLMINQTPENDEKVGYYYFYDGIVQCYDINHNFKYAGFYEYKRIDLWPRVLQVQMWPYGTRTFLPPDIVGEGRVIILKAVDAREDFVLKLQ